MVVFEICTGTDHWRRFTAFYVEHRQRIIPGYQMLHALIDTRNCMRHGRAAILTDETKRVIGIGGFTLGTEEHQFRNKEIAVLINSYFVEGYRANRTFVRGLQVIARQIAELSSEVKEVRIPTAADNSYTNALYRKIADRADAMDTPYGRFHVYAIAFDDFADFCHRFR